MPAKWPTGWVRKYRVRVNGSPADADLAPLRALHDACRRHGALLIVDEVMTGFRVSRAGWYGVDPVDADLFTFGKVMSGGLPAAAFGGRAEVMGRLAPLGPVYQAGTLSGNPVAMAAGLATLKCADAVAYQTIDRRSEQRGDDAVTDGGEPEAVLANAPDREGAYFGVPKVVE